MVRWEMQTKRNMWKKKEREVSEVTMRYGEKQDENAMLKKYHHVAEYRQEIQVNFSYNS